MQQLLTALASSLTLAGPIAGAQVVVAAPPTEAVRALGSAGFRDDPAFADRLRDCRTRGAVLVTFDDPHASGQRVVRGRRDRMLTDRRWAPLHPYLREISWSDYVATPIAPAVAHAGVINCYLAPGAALTERLLAYLRSVADVAARALELGTAVSPARDADLDLRLGRLSPREREVLALLGAALTNQQIADRLDITERTARTHVSNVLTKLDLASRTQAALLVQTARSQESASENYFS
ncbi:hypothetical protein GCM10009808_22970 [Microbacterium sediminicola]|uniref:HTH luxR-type domain-containing protein n=1 Tax=Microbacterium sediminicola TaxID=415210 RepID=A0ABN2IG53_9MICO